MGVECTSELRPVHLTKKPIGALKKSEKITPDTAPKIDTARPVAPLYEMNL
jgi:hypothetical protein